jgi:uncharacterized protein (DUF927 family)
MNESIDTLLEELSSFDYSTVKPPKREEEVEITEDSINDYILKKTGNLIDAGLGAVEDLKEYIVQGQNPDEIAALSELISSTTKAIEALNRINLHNKKTKDTKELKKMDIDGKKEIASLTSGDTTINNNIVVASRAEILERLFASANGKNNDDFEMVEVDLNNTKLIQDK